jgi:hypothetical protein
MDRSVHLSGRGIPGYSGSNYTDYAGSYNSHAQRDGDRNCHRHRAPVCDGYGHRHRAPIGHAHRYWHRASVGNSDSYRTTDGNPHPDTGFHDGSSVPKRKI